MKIVRINELVQNSKNVNLITGFFEFMKRNDTSEGYQNNNLKTIIAYCKFLGASVSLDEVNNKSQITSFLDTKEAVKTALALNMLHLLQ